MAIDFESGTTFDKFTLIGESYSANGHRTWDLKCDCGSIYPIRASRLRHGSLPRCRCKRAVAGSPGNVLKSLQESHNQLQATVIGLAEMCETLGSLEALKALSDRLSVVEAQLAKQGSALAPFQNIGSDTPGHPSIGTGIALCAAGPVKTARTEPAIKPRPRQAPDTVRHKPATPPDWKPDPAAFHGYGKSIHELRYEATLGPLFVSAQYRGFATQYGRAYEDLLTPEQFEQHQEEEVDTKALFTFDSVIGYHNKADQHSAAEANINQVTHLLTLPIEQRTKYTQWEAQARIQVETAYRNQTEVICDMEDYERRTTKTKPWGQLLKDYEFDPDKI